MTSERLTLARKDDRLIKWLLTLSSGIALLVCGQFIYMLQSSAAQAVEIQTNKNDIKDLKDFKLKLIRIEVMTEMTVNKQNEMSAQIKEIAGKQNQILSKGRK